MKEIEALRAKIIGKKEQIQEIQTEIDEMMN
jgi:hypothetical protein